MNTVDCLSFIVFLNTVLQPMTSTAQGILMVENCHGRALSLACPAGRSISIMQIELGETNCWNWNCCPRPSDCTRPASNSHRNEVLRSCNGRTSCQVTAVRESITCNGNSEFERIRYNCSDIDECNTGTSRCSPHATCTNTPGGFNCRCNIGYTGNGHSCTDIDECKSLSSERKCSPHATCSNTPGSFNCSCNSGFSGDGFTCNAATSDEPTSPAVMTMSSGFMMSETLKIVDQAVSDALSPTSFQTVPTLNDASEESPRTSIQMGSTKTYSTDYDGDFSILLGESRSDDDSVDTSTFNYNFIYFGIGAAAGLTILVVLVAVAIRYHLNRGQLRLTHGKLTPDVDNAFINGKRDANQCERTGLDADDEEDFPSLAAVDLQPQVSVPIAGHLEVLTDSTEMGAYPGYENHQG